jgi:acyl dehydratase
MSSAAVRALEMFRARIGVADPPGEWHTVDQNQINAFAETTLDRQFIHVDPVAAAQKSPYGVTIAHGFLTLSMLSHLVKSIPLPSPNPYEGVATMINYGLDRVRWPTPVRVDSRIRARRELMEADLKDARTIQLKHNVTVEIDGVDKPACVAEWLARIIYS